MTTSIISKRKAERILRKVGYQRIRIGRHEIWSNGLHQLSLPHKPSNDGLYGWMANQIQKIGAGKPPAKRFARTKS